nr:MAG TPA: hypothetical protein [Microviridae sp.]
MKGVYMESIIMIICLTAVMFPFFVLLKKLIDKL